MHAVDAVSILTSNAIQNEQICQTELVLGICMDVAREGIALGLLWSSPSHWPPIAVGIRYLAPEDHLV